MTVTQEMVAIAAAMASPARINILEALAAGAARSATDLAAIADIQANTASTHLQVLCKANLIKVVKQGRYRYFRIRDQSVSDLIELLGEQTQSEKLGAEEASLEQVSAHQERHQKQCESRSAKRMPTSQMAFARTCYDHLAGWLGVQLSQYLLDNNHIILNENSFDLTAKGKAFLVDLGVNLDAPKNTRRVFARACQDWSEGELHIGGALGAQLFHFFIDQKWMAKNADYREITVLKKGQRLLLTHFDIDVRTR